MLGMWGGFGGTFQGLSKKLLRYELIAPPEPSHV